MLSDIEVLSACAGEIQNSALTSELSAERADAMERYLGEPYGDETEQRSQIMTREVLETVEWMTPSLVRIFTDVDNVCTFEAVGPEDEDSAEQESDVCSHVFWHKNDGFYNVLSAVKDALISKTGWLKIWWDDTVKEEREEYTGLNEFDIYPLLLEEGVEREVIDHEVNDDGSHNITFLAKHTGGQVRIMPCPPEDVGVNRDASSPLVDECRFVYHQERKSRSDLVEQGFDRDLVYKIPPGTEILDEERLARRHLSDERDLIEGSMDKAAQEVWVTECYIHIDRNEDGIAELLKVVIGGTVTLPSGGAGTGIILAIDEVDRIPFVAWTPILLTHKFIGLSIADMEGDIQYNKSTLLRNLFDNIYHINNNEKVVNDRVNVEDFLVTMPGGLKRVRGNTPVGEAVMPLMKAPLPPEAFALIEVLDEMTKGRTGVGSEVAALDPQTLSNVNTGVAALAYDASRARVELVARMCAQFLIGPAFQHIHELMSKNVKHKLPIKLRGEWTEVQPSEWRNRENLRVNVGIGRASKERRILALEQIMAKQQQAVDGGGLGTLLTTDNLYASLHDYTKLLGEDPQKYWTDPQTIEPPQPEPTPQELALQLQGQIEQMRLQLEARKQQMAEAKLKLDAEARIVEQSIKQRQLETTKEIAAIKAEQGVQKQVIDEKSQIMNAQAQLFAKEADVAIKQHEAKLRERIEEQKLLLEARGQDIEQYKAELASVTKLVSDMKCQLTETAERSEAMMRAADHDTRELKSTMSDKLEKLLSELNEPIKVEKDESGNITKIGGVTVEVEGEEAYED